MDHTTLIWTAFVDEHAGRATLVRERTGEHGESAVPDPDLASDLVSVWVDGDGVPVVVEARLDDQPRTESGAGALEAILAPVLGPVSLGSPTLWGLVPGWVWFGVPSVWPPLTDEEAAIQRRHGLDDAAERAKRNAARRARVR